MAEEERKYFTVYNDLQVQKQTLNTYITQYNSAVQTLNSFTQQKQQLDFLRKQMIALLDKCFNGPTADFPEEDILENNCNLAAQQVNQLQNTLSQYKYGYTHLTQARDSLLQADRELAQAIDMSTVDMFMGGGYANMMVSMF